MPTSDKEVLIKLSMEKAKQALLSASENLKSKQLETL